MGQFCALFKKTYILHKRNLCGTIIEMLLPIFFVIILGTIGRQQTKTEKADYSYLDIVYEKSDLFPTDFTDWNTVFNPSTDTYFIKNCGQYEEKGGSRSDTSTRYYRGGKVGLAPDNALTRKIGAQFESQGLVTWYMNSDSEMTDMMRSGANYGHWDADTNQAWQFCFAITFEEQTDNKYYYNLRYNFTGPEFRDDVWDPIMDQLVTYKIEDTENGWYKNLYSGFDRIMSMVDNFIFQDAFGVTNSASPNVFIKPTVTQMPIKNVKRSDLYTISGSGRILSMTCYLGCLAIFGRLVYMMLYEKYIRVSDNLKNMGMSTFTNMMAWLLFKFIQHFIVTFMVALLAKAMFFPNQHFFNVYILYFMTQWFMIMLAFCLQTFFVNTKQGTFMALVGSAVFFISSLSLDTNDDPSKEFSTRAAFSPIAGLQLAAKILIIYEEQFIAFNDWNKWVGNFQFGTWFIITFWWCIILFILAIWLDQVFPTEIGEKKHPCFCFGCKKKDKNKVHDNRDDDVTPKEEDIEPVDEALLAQRKNNQTLSINGLRKVYSNEKVAIKQLNLEMYSNQIFALLGQNGAGKTTTISIISGLLSKTKGDISILGLNRDNELDKIRGTMGICPQTNPIYDELTVQEHMELYYEIKTKSDNLLSMKEQIEKILTDIDLNHKKDYMAGKLSGGQKRKLCVATALIGGSKVLLLDEPTSGMDAYARRHLWEMLKEYKKDRLIILTTHYMDEADFLGDRIAIMKEGRLITVGSSLFLKNKYGVGYDLTILKTPSDNSNSSIVNSVQQFIPEAYIIGQSGMELKLRLPIDTVHKFKELFQTLELNKETMGIETYGISLSTLDQVFIKVNGGGDEEKFKSKKESIMSEKKSQNDVEQEMEEIPDKKNITEKGMTRQKSVLQDDNVVKISSPYKLFKMHFFALTKKKWLHFKRDKKSIACELIVPIICIFFGCLLTLVSWIKDSPSQMLDSTLGGSDAQPFNIYVAAQTPADATSLWSSMNDDTYINVNTQTATSQSAFDTLLLNSISQNYVNNWYNIFAESITTNSVSGLYQYTYTVWQNTTMPHAGNLAVATMNNLLFQAATGSTSNYIKHNIEPFPNPKIMSKFDATADSIFLSWLLGIAWCFQPAGMVVYVVKEREINAKHQQLVSGVSLLAYWSSCLCVDLAKYYVVMIWFCISMQVFGVQGMIAGDHYGALWIIVVLYGPALVSFTYCTSFLWRDPGKAQTMTFLINLFFGFILVFAGWLLQLIKSTRTFSNEVLVNLFRLICPFAGLYGVFNISNTNLWYTIFRQSEEPDALSWDVSVPDIIFLCFHCWIWFVLIFVIEYNRSQFSWCYKKKVNRDLNVVENEEDAQLNEIKDDDVKAEEEYVKTSNEISIKVQNLRKVYSIETNSGFCKKGKNISYKVAVKDVTFGVKQGDCFCLLGTNGAGKTSCFKMLSGELLSTKGSAYIKGYDVVTELPKIRSQIGYCPQFDALFENLTAREHIEFYADIKGIAPKDREQLVRAALTDQGLTEFEHVMSKNYSGGNKRKLSVAIAQIGSPEIIFLDEPSSGMDPQARRFMWNVISTIGSVKKQASIILTTHSMEEAEALSTKLAIMVEGNIKCIGAPQSLKEKYGNGYEIEVKMKLPTKDELLLLSGHKDIKELAKTIPQSGLADVFKKLNCDDLIRQISKKGTGSDIWKMYERKMDVELTVLQEFVYLQNHTKKITQFLINIFGSDAGIKKSNLSDGFMSTGTRSVKILEIFQSFIRFKIEGDHKLHELFGEMEENKIILGIAQYSIKQISIEQIFISLADQVDHDD